MFVESFVLTTEPPEIRAGSLIAGELHDGIFTTSSFPTEIEFGAVLELSLDEDDPPGTFTVEILVEYARLPGTPQTPVGEPFTIEALEPDVDWWGPRLNPQPLKLRLKFWDEFEGYLVVRVNDEEIAEKAIRVIHHAVPDALG